MKSNRNMRVFIFLLLIVVSGVILRIPFIRHELSSDEALFGLMAKHIMGLKEFPIYLGRTHYSGVLNSYIGAIFFRVFGISSISYKAVQFLFAIPFIFIIYLLGKKAFNENLGLLSALFVAIPSFFVIYSFMQAHGNNMEGLLFGALILLLTCHLVFTKMTIQKEFLLLSLLGFCSGFGLWLSPHIIPFLITTLIMFLMKDRKIFFSKKIVLFLICFCIGHIPALIYSFQHPLASFYRFGGRILDLDRSVLSTPNPTKIVLSKVLWRISTVPASFMRIPRLLLPLMGLEKHLFSNVVIWPIIIIIYWSSFIYIIFSRRKIFISFIKKRLSILKMQPIDICIIFTFVYVIFYSCLVGKDRARYMLPFYVVIPIFLSVAFLEVRKRSKTLFFILLTLILSINLLGNLKSLKFKPQSYINVTSFLSKKGIFHGYSEYSTAYPIIFASKEKIIISPCAFDTYAEHYPAYTEEVNSAKNVAYIFNTSTYPQIPSIFERRLEEIKVTCKKEIIPPFIVYYNFSRRVFPEGLELKDLRR